MVAALAACGGNGDTPAQSATTSKATREAPTFPTASGVNPMVTIEAIAHMNASALAERLT
jgi:long-chain-alcohol oxidase